MFTMTQDIGLRFAVTKGKNCVMWNEYQQKETLSRLVVCPVLLVLYVWGISGRLKWPHLAPNMQSDSSFNHQAVQVRQFSVRYERGDADEAKLKLGRQLADRQTKMIAF